LKPIFDGICFGVAKTVWELISTSFYFTEDTFDAIPIPMSDVLESEPVTMTGGVKPRRAINEKDRIVNLMFLAEFGEKHRGNRGISRRRELDV